MSLEPACLHTQRFLYKNVHKELNGFLKITACELKRDPKEYIINWMNPQNSILKLDLIKCF